MMGTFSTAFISCFLITFIPVRSHRSIYAVDERFVCNVKMSCVECLRLPHCSWCKTENKCMSTKMPEFEYFCITDRLDHKDYGFTLEGNAKCICEESEKTKQCYPPEVFSGPQCSGRGTCVCGHCVCDPTPDPENPAKKVLGEYCEYDNYSCDDPKCSEGPYLLNVTAVEMPLEENEVKETSTTTSTTAMSSFGWFGWVPEN